jgi:hypothetical protein|uniref:DUF4097 family beta strand repeat-containing protein n=1 Tax=Cephaloticoccus sp. TaxID=1985742 RepID=UPI00404A54A0
MKTSQSCSSLLLAASVAALLLMTSITAPRAHGEENTTTVKFSDPAKPGTLRVNLKMGDVAITGTDDKEVSVQTEFESEDAPTRDDGLRVISESATFSLTEKNNTVTLDTGDSWAGFSNDAEFIIHVPRNTNIVVSNGFGGEVIITDIDGDIEVKSLNGEIALDNFSGGALVETMNGEIMAKVRKLSENKPLSFTSMNGEIDIRLPADAQAKIRLRTQNGAILTDFDDKSLVTKTESVRGNNRSGHYSVNIDGNSEIRTAVREAVRAGMEAARETAEAMRETAAAMREAAAEAHDGGIVIVPPVPPVPPMTGGKLVSGALNGGAGPEIYAAAMNGDVTLRKTK